MSVFPLYDAQKQAKKNASEHARLKKTHEGLCARNKKELDRHNAARASVVADLLTPFEAAFRQIRNIDIAELERLDSHDDISFESPELKAIRLDAAASVAAVATSVAAGFGTSAAATAAVTAFATASTGTAISSLSGAAATSAMLAWLGGGSLAAGGGGVAAGTMVLTALTAAPAVLVAGAFLHHQGGRQLRKQREVAAQLRRANGELQTLSERWAACRARSKAVRKVLVRLVAASAPRLAWLQGRVAKGTDYRAFSHQDRARLATLVALVTTTIAVMKADLFDDQMLVTSVSADAVRAATTHLDQLGTPAGHPPSDA